MSELHGEGVRPWPALFQQPWADGGVRFFQIGFVVDDVVAHGHRWAEVFGVGPFFVRKVPQASCTYRGEASTLSVNTAVAQAGPVQIELSEAYWSHVVAVADAGRSWDGTDPVREATSDGYRSL